MGQIYQEGYYVRKCLIFVNYEQALLKTGQSWDVQSFPVLLVSLATARKHWLGYFSLNRTLAPQCTELYWWTHTSIAGPAGASRIKDTVLGRFGVGVLGPGATGGRYRRIHLLVAGQWIERFES